MPVGAHAASLRMSSKPAARRVAAPATVASSSTGPTSAPRPPTPPRPAPPFRRGTPSDAPAIRALVWGARMNPLGLDPGCFVVADGDAEGGGGGGLAAIGQLVPLEGGEGAVEVRSLVVSPDRRGTGMGSALLAALVQSAPAGARSVWLTTLADRALFYERAGFQVVPPPGGDGGGGWLLGALSRDAPIPAAMRFEAVAGSVVGPLLGGAKLIVMKRDLC